MNLHFSDKLGGLALCIGLSAALPTGAALGQNAPADAPAGRIRGAETQQDLPGDFHPYYGQKLNRYRDLERRIAKIDLDADLNMDGAIKQGDPQDQGAFEQTPPGLIVGVAEMSKIMVSLIPYRVDFDGDVVVGFEVTGINRASDTGTFQSMEEEQSAVGRVRVWADPQRKKLLLDSADPLKRRIEFAVDSRRYPANLPSIVPRVVYVEGVKPSGKYLGDLRLLATVSHESRGETEKAAATGRRLDEELAQANGGARKPDAGAPVPTGVDTPSPALKVFRTAFDHILLTILEKPAQKQFVNNNAEGVWIELNRGK